MFDRERQLAAYERNKLTRGSTPAKPARDWSFWFPLGMSVLSLFISLATAYFNTFLQEDDLRVFIGPPPGVSRNKVGEIALHGAQEFTFINSGNRSAAITLVAGNARVLRTDNNDEDRRCAFGEEGANSVAIAFDAKPFVIKPGEIRHISTLPEAMILFWNAERDHSIPTVRLNRGIHQSKGSQSYLVCVMLSFVIPDGYATRWQKAAYLLSFDDAGDEYAKETPLFEVGKPMAIAAERRIRMGVW